MPWTLPFISEEDFRNHVIATIEKYGEKLDSYDIRRFNSNIVDPIKLIFDKMVYRSTWEEIVKNEIFRQRDKSNNNDIGYFHQRIFQYIEILIELKRGNQIYHWPAYEKVFGYITISEIKSSEAVSKYITKYITKELNATRVDLNDHLYYCSKGLNRAKKLYQGQLKHELDAEFSNEYVEVKTVRSLNEALKYFVDD